MVSEAKPRRSVLRRVASVVGWVWGSLSILLGLVMLATASVPSGRVVGLSALSAGILLLPPVGRWISRRVALFARPGIPLLSSIVAGVTILIVNPYPAPEPRERPRAEREGGPSGRPAEQPTNPGPLAFETAGSESQRRLEAEIQAMWRELTRVTQPCDAAAERASAALQPTRGSLTGAYSVVREAKQICASAGLDAMQVSLPPSLGRQERRAFDEALNDCGMAYAGKSVLFDRMLVVIDGDRRPSRLAAVQEAGRQSQAQTVQCVVRLTELANEQGVSLEGEGT